MFKQPIQGVALCYSVVIPKDICIYFMTGTCKNPKCTDTRRHKYGSSIKVVPTCHDIKYFDKRPVFDKDEKSAFNFYSQEYIVENWKSLFPNKELPSDLTEVPPKLVERRPLYEKPLCEKPLCESFSSVSKITSKESAAEIESDLDQKEAALELHKAIVAKQEEELAILREIKKAEIAKKAAEAADKEAFSLSENDNENLFDLPTEVMGIKTLQEHMGEVLKELSDRIEDVLLTLMNEVEAAETVETSEVAKAAYKEAKSKKKAGKKVSGFDVSEKAVVKVASKNVNQTVFELLIKLTELKDLQKHAHDVHDEISDEIDDVLSKAVNEVDKPLSRIPRSSWGDDEDENE